MKIVVCVSDEVLNSQHYKHSQSTEASDQYANTRKIIYLNTADTQFWPLASLLINLYLQSSETDTHDLLHYFGLIFSPKHCFNDQFHSDFDAESI